MALLPAKPVTLTFTNDGAKLGWRTLFVIRRLIQIWRSYMVAPKTDWWVPFYPADKMQRPTGPLCDSCHSVNYNVLTRAVSEWNVGCEKCHGPGSLHVQKQSQTNIINPARLDTIQATNVCIQCHSQGQPLNNPIAGKYYDWPVGFEVGEDLKDYWKLEEHKLGDRLSQ